MASGLERTGPCRCNDRVGLPDPARPTGVEAPFLLSRVFLGSDPMFARWKEQIRRLNQELAALALAVRRPDVPWYAKALGVFVIAYALSPIDLIPDFIPVLGLLDDLLLVPLGILAVRALVPAAVLAECRAEVAKGVPRPRTGWIAAVVIVAIWATVLGALLYWLFSPGGWLRSRSSTH